MLAASISVHDLFHKVGTDQCPIILDVRRDAVFADAPHVLPTARRATHTDVRADDYAVAPHGVVAYCVHGHNVSQFAIATLRSRGIAAARLEGGIAAWTAAGFPLVARAPDGEARFGAGTIWITRQRPKIDRIACPWFIRRFVDDRARFLFVEPEFVLTVADEAGGIAVDVEGAPIAHDGPRCSFDLLLDRYGVTDPVLRRLAEIIRGADTDALDLAREAAGLLAVSLGLSALEPDDHRLLAKALTVYDGLYAYLRFAVGERHTWPRKA